MALKMARMVDRRQLRDILSKRKMIKSEYPLKEVKQLARERRVLFVPRKDGKADPGNVRMTIVQACDVIANLAPKDFDITSYKGGCPADVYKVPYIRPGFERKWLYIKLQIAEDETLLVVISFHI